MRRIVLWTALALLGLLIAVGVTTAATSLTSQRVGLQSEPLDAGEALAPRATATPERTRTPERTATPTATVESDDHGGDDDDDSSGRGRGRGRGRGGDDDD